jgi:threonine/homoserine/homoserine lactone efflux protein
MDIATLIAKIVGAVLLVWTCFSIFKHIKQKREAHKAGSNQSLTEQFLNNLLLYLWLAFMLAFSSGMILNN